MHQKIFYRFHLRLHKQDYTPLLTNYLNTYTLIFQLSSNSRNSVGILPVSLIPASKSKVFYDLANIQNPKICIFIGILWKMNIYYVNMVNKKSSMSCIWVSVWKTGYRFLTMWQIKKRVHSSHEWIFDIDRVCRYYTFIQWLWVG